MKVAYIRSATNKTDEQISTLKGLQVEKYFIDENASGMNINRSKLTEMLDFVKSEDIVYVTDLSRLSRNVKHISKIIEDLEHKNVKLISLKEGLDTNTEAGKLALKMVNM